MAERQLKILVLSSFDGTNANVIRDFLFSFRLHSRHQYYYVFDCRVLDESIDFRSFDVILVFWSLYLLGPDLSEEVRERIREAPACKILSLQDEYRDVRRFNRVMAELGINVMFTCVAESDHEIFYPRALIPSLQGTYTILTGYVPTYLHDIRPNWDSPRPLDIGYRSREVPFYLGDLGREKKIVADRFEALAAEHGFRVDISVRERDRLYGHRWVEFLQASRFVLGSASGASVIDFSGEIRRNCERYLGVHPNATYEEVKTRFFASEDWKTVIDTVSPRMFEAAALSCVLVQHEGWYAGILAPDVHYICIKRDYSNIGDVIGRMKDAAFCRRMAERTYTDLIRSGRYTYRAFVERFDGILARHVQEPRRSYEISPARFYARNYVRHDQAIVPYKERFLVLPSRKLVFELMRRGLAKLAGGRHGPALSRLIQNPGNFVTKMLLAVRVVYRSRPLRVILLEYLKLRPRGDEVSFIGLVNDLVKIDVVRRARAGRLRSRPRFLVAVTHDPQSGVVTLASFAPDAEGATAAEGVRDRSVLQDLLAALLGGKLSIIMWDHSMLMSMEIVYSLDEAPRRPRWITVGLGMGGVYRFETLTYLCRRAPHVVGPALVSLLSGVESPYTHDADEARSR